MQGGSLRILLGVTAFVGVLVMGYLVSVHYSEEDSSFCDLGAGLSCDVVNKSVYAKVAGIPLSVLGFLYFAALLLAVLFRYQKSLKSILFLSIAFLGPSVYLSYLELYVIKNICVFCEVSKVLILLAILFSYLAIRPRVSGKMVLGAVLVGAVLGGATYLIQRGAVPSDEYNEFAQCLRDKGYIMYGSLGCSFCARQRAIFGDSFEYIKEIECDPRYPNAQVDRCVAINIEHTPTWVVEDSEGNITKRYEPGVLQLEDLAGDSGCALTPNGGEDKE